MMGGARWSTRRNFHSRLCLEMNSDWLLCTTGSSRISCGVTSRPVATNTIFSV